VADATRIKVHIIDAIENNDFSGIAAPLYGKGFIKLYAECVGLDPAPLIRDYMERHARQVQPTLRSEKPPAPPMADGIPGPSTLERFRSSGGAAWDKVLGDVVEALRETGDTLTGAWTRWRMAALKSPPGSRRYTRAYPDPIALPVWRYAALGIALLVVVVLLVSGIGHLVRRAPEPPKVPDRGNTARPAGVRPLRLAEEPRPSHLKVRAP
jgi:hypothetical protein